ncbi:flagellar assembly protein FliW [Paenibacillus tarimensis]|uniref:flagellar assembly protein FliW n=1 Tax=Paenibacillus tarimensis TaxID=416012 RepID=UPI001F165D00|nr:flagellar assembly protein FliW [Paenibacillus tarimensis]MCF2944126.1 flagellar assembly protein FliW [Paenibacillus tarimensis]
MELQTSRFGTLAIKEEDIYTFTKGIPGFEDETEFVILEADEDGALSYLHSTTNPALMFIIADPFVFYPEYQFDAPETVQEDLKLEGTEQLMIRSIVSVRDNWEQATINLVAPIILNMENRLGRQIVLGTNDYTTRHPLLRSHSK